MGASAYTSSQSVSQNGSPLDLRGVGNGGLPTASVLESPKTPGSNRSNSSPRIMPDGAWGNSGADVGGGSLNTPRGDGAGGGGGVMGSVLSTFGRSGNQGTNEYTDQRRPSFFTDNVPKAETEPMWYTDKIIARPMGALLGFLFLPMLFTVYVLSEYTLSVDIGVDAFTIIPSVHF